MGEDEARIVLADIQREVRQRWRGLTQYRVGLVAGERAARGEPLIACPYETPRGIRLFAEGVETGREAALPDPQRLGQDRADDGGGRG